MESFVKITDIKFHENMYSGSRDISCGQADWQETIMKLIIAFLVFVAQAPKNWHFAVVKIELKVGENS